MVGQRANDPAVLERAAVARADHAGQFSPKRPEPFDLALDLSEMLGGQCIDSLAGIVGVGRQAEQFENVLDGETEVAGVADEFQPFEVRFRIAPLPTPGSGRRRHQAAFLIVSDRRDFRVAATGQIANRQAPNFRHSQTP